jgi:RecB family exonuclease
VRLAEERRLFYVAVTRARRRLVVTAVRSPDEVDERPSRFLDELGLPVPERVEGPAGRLTAASLVARLRRVTVSGDAPAGLRAAAAVELARFAAPRPADRRPRMAAALPGRWWGVSEFTLGAVPVRPAAAPVALSASAVAAVEDCPLKWFLEREAKAVGGSTSQQGFGLVVHALAHIAASSPEPPDLDGLLLRLDEVWPALGFDAPLQAQRERRQATDALRRLLRWQAASPRGHVASEADFDVTIGDVRLRGSVDRLDREPDGRLVVVDLKTSSSSVPVADAERHAQLGVYQLAVREGAFSELVGSGAAPGGAELLFVRRGTRDGTPQTRAQSPLGADEEGGSWVDVLLREVVGRIRAEEFPARVSAGCERCPFRRACPAHDAGRPVVP